MNQREDKIGLFDERGHRRSLFIDRADAGSQHEEGEVDELVCPYRPDPFLAVGVHYQTFRQTSDEEVERLLAEHREQREPAPISDQTGVRADRTRGRA